MFKLDLFFKTILLCSAIFGFSGFAEAASWQSGDLKHSTTTVNEEFKLEIMRVTQSYQTFQHGNAEAYELKQTLPNQPYPGMTTYVHEPEEGNPIIVTLPDTDVACFGILKRKVGESWTVVKTVGFQKNN